MEKYIKCIDNNNCNDLSNDLSILTFKFIECDLTNLPPSLDKIILMSDDPFISLNNDLIEESGYCIIKYEIKLPYGCEIYKNDTKINNFCGFIQIKQKIYINNYNILRIMSGLGGLAYSN